jgi:hypothetical protein
MQDISERGNIPAKMNEGRLQEEFVICRPQIARFDLSSDRKTACSGCSIQTKVHNAWCVQLGWRSHCS